MQSEYFVKVYNLHNFTAVLQMLWFGDNPAKVEGTYEGRRRVGNLGDTEEQSWLASSSLGLRCSRKAGPAARHAPCTHSGSWVAELVSLFPL